MTDRVSKKIALEHKLPALIGALLLATILAIGIGAYAEVRRTAMAAASERLVSVTAQLSDLFQQSGVQLRRLAATDAHKPDLSPAKLGYDGPNQEQVVASELRDSTGAVIASTGAWSADVRALPVAELRTIPGGDSVTIGTFRVVRDTIVYPVAARIPGPAHSYLVRWRKLGGSRRTREQMGRLIGSEATLFLGSRTGGPWTDLEQIVAPPPLDSVRHAGSGTFTSSLDGQRYLSAESAIPGTPWTVVTHFPVATVLAPATRFAQRIVVIVAVALLLGLFGTWYVSRRILRDLEHTIAQRTLELNQVLVELRDAQDSLVRREKLAMLGQLASGVGHELRNPLGVMTNAIYFLKMVLDNPPPQVAEYLDILQQQITLSEKIVGDLLDFARLKQPQRKPASLAEITRAQLARMGNTSGISVENELSSVPPVLVDEVQIGQVVLNLLTNAMQAMDGSGRIVIRARTENSHVEYEVADTGPGIPPENMVKIFEPLFTTKARGIGLGLAVSRTLARANDGELTVTSAPGQGATFHLRLPTAKEGGSGQAAGRSAS